MTPCERRDDSWQVVIHFDNGKIAGAGVLLDNKKWVLTCAHVLQAGSPLTPRAAAELRPLVESVVCRPRWSTPARVLPGHWIGVHDTQRGDLALLELDTPVTCHRGAALRQAPVRGVKVRMRGFPDGDKIGTSAEGQLAGATNGGEWVEIHPRGDNRAQWVTCGFSGAGVAEDTNGEVVGIIMAVREANSSVVAYMMPVETIVDYFPMLKNASGGRTSDPIFSRNSDHLAVVATDSIVSPGDAAADVALRQEIGRLFTGVWSGTAVITGGDPHAGSPWLVRLVATADPGVRRRISEAAIAQAPPGVVLGVGTIDLAIDASGQSVDWIRHRIADRFQLPVGDCADLVARLLRHEPRPTLVIDRVDSARDPEGLLAALVAPLAAQARRRGLRLVLGFAALVPPAGLRHELSLGPEPVTGTAQGPAGEEEVRRLVTDLAEAEQELATWYARVSVRVADAPVPQPGIAPWLRVRYAAATSGPASGRQPVGELALIGGRASAALADTERHVARLRELDGAYNDLAWKLKVYLERARRRFGAEDLQLSEVYGRARGALGARPCDLDAARVAVDAYLDAVSERERVT